MTTDHNDPQHQPGGQIADAPRDNWVDKTAPDSLQPYLQLARMDRPIGTWLLLFPCWWGLALAGISQPTAEINFWHFVLFAIGAVVMRGAGCAFNDYVDRDYDAKVERTKGRPIPSGRVSPNKALLFVAALSGIGLLVVLQFNLPTIALAISSLLLVAIYPFMKRYTYWPQVMLGLVFNWGALVGWTASQETLSFAPVLLYLGAVFWTIGYDTIYAHQDRDDDALLGLKSTALRFGARTPTWLGFFYSATVLLWAASAYSVSAGLPVYIALAIVALHFSWQISTLDINDPDNSLVRFRSNRDVGAILFIGLIAHVVLEKLAIL